MSQNQTRLDRLNANLTSINGELAQLTTNIDNLTTSLATGGLSEVYVSKMTAHKTRLEQKKTFLESRKARLEVQITSTQALIDNDTAGFSTGQQTTVDAINTLFSDKYAANLISLKCKSTQEKADFFTMYTDATSDALRELAIRAYFGLDI